MATFSVIPLPVWAASAPPRRPSRTRNPRLVAAVYQRVALTQLVTVAADVMACDGLPVALRDDLALTLAAAWTALAETGGEEAAA